MKLAVVVTNLDEADRLEKLGHIKVGFMCCPIKRRVMVLRCHRCLGYGHIARSCAAEDRSAACFRCEEADHKYADCKKSPSCFLCKKLSDEKISTNHVAGSGGCGVFKSALEEAKKTLARTKNK
ncbi:CCHC-type zinc finger nucleic acid binding protein-like [Leptopilina boulardi]|uniref:CCHC-type zinc finger nucleic acid binding protein-like n=1 Tax=Leptopilina boulardi TaxID=63433 RepID=UPI0021F56A39|nr:CCHC-type zinc finger nucleic acid binding protein-like [Leptopilina boulardi]